MLAKQYRIRPGPIDDDPRPGEVIDSGSVIGIGDGPVSVNEGTVAIMFDHHGNLYNPTYMEPQCPA